MAAPELLIAAWFLVLGGAVGSFLNVVVYRLPAGMSIIRPASHCPMCRHPIRWFDNIPVLGWALLRGRCRDCRAPISLRYPLVEAATAALFVLLAVQEGLSGGANLPARGTLAADAALLPAWAVPQVYGLCAYHLLLLCTLLAAALIEYDGKPAPWRLFMPALVVGLTAPVAWPWLHPVAAWHGVGDGRLAGLLDGAAGIAAGALWGGLWLLVGCVQRTGPAGCVPRSNESAATPSVRCTHPTAALACVGLFLGWQAVCALAVLTWATDGLVRLAARGSSEFRRLSATAWLGLASLVWILAWAHLAGWLAMM